MAWEFYTQVGNYTTMVACHSETPDSVQSSMQYVAGAGDTNNGQYPFLFDITGSGSSKVTVPMPVGYIQLNNYSGNINFAFYNENDEVCCSIKGQRNNINVGVSFVINHDTQQAKVWAYSKLTNNNLRRIDTNNSSWTTNQPAKLYTLLLANSIISIPANGGGATHIAKVTGQLSSLSNNLSDILMVSGGGGGGMLVGSTANGGADAGGISGNGTLSADQTTGYGFGQGESGTNVSGGGGGLYGGYKGTSALSGGAGSGYIGNSLVSNKKMVGYNVPTSSAENTKTDTTQSISAVGEPDKPKIGNGKAKIKLIGQLVVRDMFDLFTTIDVSSAIVDSQNRKSAFLTPNTSHNDFLPYLTSKDKIFIGGSSDGKNPPTINSTNKTIAIDAYGNDKFSWCIIPIPHKKYVTKVHTQIMFTSKYSRYATLAVCLYYTANNDINNYLWSGIEEFENNAGYIYWEIQGNYDVNVWYDLDIEVSQPIPVDFVGFGGGSCTFEVKNMTVTSE